jgi:tetratricopeptide (TPR) repeat protein
MSRRYVRRTVVAGLVAAMAVACSKPSAEDHFKKGNEYTEKSKWAEAALEYKTALNADQKRGDIRLKLADTLMQLSDGKGALREYARAADQLPNDVTAQLRAGILLHAFGQFEDAKTRANKALALDPKNVDAQILLGNTLAGLKDFNGAISEYQEAIALNPSGDTAYINIANAEVRLGKRVEAEATFRKAVEVAPKSVQARLALAGFLWGTGRPTDAETVFKEALALDPKNIVANRALGLFYLGSNRIPEAEPYFVALAENSKTPEAEFGLADYYLLSKRYADATTILKRLATTPAHFAQAMTRLASIDVVQNNRVVALSKLKEVKNKEPKNVAARLMIARILLMDGKRDEALAEANGIVTDAPNTVGAGEALLLVGGIHASLDRVEEAIAAYEGVLKRQAQPFAADLALATLHLRRGAYDAATSYAQQALVIRPGNPVARVTLARISLLKLDMTRARAEIAALAKEFPNVPTVLNLVAAEQLTSKQWAAAKANYLRVLQMTPHDLEATTGVVNIELATGQPKEALARIEATLKSQQPSVDFLIVAAQVYAMTGNLAKTEELLKKAIEVDPARLRAYGMLAQFYGSQKRVDDALDQYRKVVERNPKAVPANTLIAMLLEGQNRIAEAEKQYEKVLAIDSRAAIAANNLAWIYVASNRNLDQALQLAQTAQQQFPEEPHINDTLGWIYYKKNMAPQAIRHLEISVRADAGADPSSQYHLGMAYYRGGDLEKAKKSLQAALGMKRPFEGEDEARRTLTAIGG